MPKPAKRSEAFSFALTKEEKRQLVAIANRAGLSRSAWIRMLIKENANAN